MEKNDVRGYVMLQDIPSKKCVFALILFEPMRLQNQDLSFHLTERLRQRIKREKKILLTLFFSPTVELKCASEIKLCVDSNIVA